MESHDPYGRLKRGKVVSYVHSTDPRIRSSGSPSVTFHSPTGATSASELLKEIQTELNGHPRRDAIESYCTMVASSLRTVRENLRDGNMELVSIELYRLGVWVERMRGELHPSRGGNSEERPRKVPLELKRQKSLVAQIQKLMDRERRKNRISEEAAFNNTRNEHPLKIGWSTFRALRKKLKRVC